MKPSEPRKILVVDDSKNVRDIVTFMLRGRGYEVVEAADGPSALESVRAGRPDLVVLDAMMPGLTGWEVASALRGEPATSRLPIVMLSAIARANGGTEEQWRATTQVDAFVAKPFKVQDLLVRIESLLERAGGGSGQRLRVGS